MEKTTYYRSEYLEIIHLKNRPITYSEHNHVSMYTIGLVIEGTITLKYGEQINVFSRNSFFVIRPYQVHTLLLPKIYNLLSFCIHKDLIIKYRLNDLCCMLTDFLSQLSLSVNDKLLRNAVTTIYPCEPFQAFDSNIMKSAFTLWQNPESNLQVRNMADEVCLSKFYYIKRFKQNIGITPHKFKLQNMVRRAQRMIENGEHLTEIASQLGFYDQSHFIKCFKAVVGITPTKYKQSFRKL